MRGCGCVIYMKSVILWSVCVLWSCQSLARREMFVTCKYLLGELMGGGPLPCQYRPLFVRFVCGLTG